MERAFLPRAVKGARRHLGSRAGGDRGKRGPRKETPSVPPPSNSSPNSEDQDGGGAAALPPGGLSPHCSVKSSPLAPSWYRPALGCDLQLGRHASVLALSACPHLGARGGQEDREGNPYRWPMRSGGETSNMRC